MLHIVVYYDAAVTTATLEEMDAQDDDRIMERRDPALRDVCPIGTDLQYVQLTCPSMPNMGLYVQVNSTNSMTKGGVTQFEGTKLTPGNTMTVSAYQDSGGNQAEKVALIYSYDTRQPKKKGSPCGQYLSPTSGNLVWGATTNFANLDANKKYQIQKIIGEGTAPYYFRFTHPDFKGLFPGGVITASDIATGNQDYCFPENDCPIFSGKYPAGIQLWGDGNAVNVTIQMVEI